jgi:hypothetical protein
MLSTSASLRLITTDMAKSLKQTAAKPDVARDIKYYQDTIGTVKSIDDFLKNKRLFNFAMKAFGLGDMSYATGLMKKALQEGVTSSTSFANRFADTRYKDFVTAFNFKSFGPATTVMDAASKDVVDKYVRQTLEENAGQQNEGVRLALYFQRKAPDIKNAYGILADKALLQVTQTALGLSSYTSMMNIDSQAKMISNKLKISDLQDAGKLQKFLNRFTANWEMQSSASSTTLSNPILISTQQTGSVGIGMDLLTSLQNLKRGGF